MTTASQPGLDLDVLSALPMGICLFGHDGRKQAATDTFFTLLNLPAAALRDGASLHDSLLVLAHAGAFGPGDPDQQAQTAATADYTQPRRMRSRGADRHRSLEWQFATLSDGRLLITLIDQSPFTTRRTQAEQHARRMVEIFEALPIGVAVLDATRTLRLANRRFAELLACPPDALPVGITLEQLSALLKTDIGDIAFSETYLPWQVVERALASEAPQLLALETGERVQLTGRHLPAAGWVVTASAVNPTNAPSRRDRLMEQIVHTLPHGVCLYGPDRRLRLVNRAFLELGWRQDIAIGDSFDASPLQYPPHTESPEIDTSRPHFLHRATPAGVALDVHLIPMADGGFAAIVSDVTAFGSGAEAAGDGLPEGPTHAVLQSLAHGVLLWDHDRRLVAWNPKAAELLELPAGRLAPGLRHSDLMTDLAATGVFGGPDETRTRLRDLLERDRTLPHMHRRNTQSGRILEVQSNPVAGGGFVVSYTDVTAYRRTEESLRREREAAEVANAAKSHFLASMSHELRTPLNAIIGYSEALAREATESLKVERGDGFTGRAAEFAGTIHQAGQDLLNLVNTILDVARIESGRFELAADRVEIANLVAACVRHIGAEARAAEVTLWVDLPKSLPILMGDERRLRQALTQILANAVKFTPPGGSVRIDAAHTREGDLLLRVLDSGIGIAEAEQSRVFEPFVQLDTGLSRRNTGPGLGLYVARALIRAHDGDLTLTSAPGKGTTAITRLPAARLA